MRPDDEVTQDIANSLANLGTLDEIVGAIITLAQQIDRTGKRIEEQCFQIAKALREQNP